MQVSELSQMTNGFAWYSNYSINQYYAAVCEVLDQAPETNPIQSGPAHGRKTKELHPTMVVIPSPRDRLISSFGRVINLPFALAETIQILGGLNDPQALKYYNSQIIQVQGDIPEGGTESDVKRFNAAYGERFRHYYIDLPVMDHGIDQLENVIEALRKDPNSRQASIVISHPYFDYYKAPTKDRACNVYAHAMIRDGKLDWMQVMRSNDIIWGLPYNFIQWCHVQEFVATQLGVPIGSYTLVQDSLHVYEDFYADVSKIEYCDMYSYMKPEDRFVMRSRIPDILYWERMIRTRGPLPLPRGKGLDYWVEVMYLFNAFSVFKNHAEMEMNIFKWMPYTFELRWPLLRWFCSVRWSKDNKYTGLMEACIEDLVNNGWPTTSAKRWLAGV